MDKPLKLPYLQKDDQRRRFPGLDRRWRLPAPVTVDEEFTNFGQHYRYPYIPDKEFWIDQEAEHDERQFFIDHLLVEHELMAKGMSYGEALTAADQAERKGTAPGGRCPQSNPSGAVAAGPRHGSRTAVERTGEWHPCLGS